MSITITSPRVSDAELIAIWGRENESLRDYEDDEWYSPSLLREWIADPKEDIILVARDGDKLIGMCLVHGMRGWAYISSLYVVQEYGSQGIGTRLLTSMTEILKKRNICTIALLVNETHTETQDFYGKRGFKKCNHFRWMEKKL
jgi:ribosomal protein S18 acetylase RimI-like enzyme